ncbi:MAG TPA: methyltransferase domain-containing protein [Ktedonobacteraceae bacterium]|nr:methyltransferase domain-containing protein [Ktedonobacteraceae bacterium]
MEQQLLAELDQELARIEEEYRKRDAGTIPLDRYSLFNAATLLHVQSLERQILSSLKRHHFYPLTEKKILDVGCGSGNTLQSFARYGAAVANLYGIDLMKPRIERARNTNPALHWQVGSAHQLPYEDASFDLVTSFVLFSSVLSEPLRQKIADEMWRVLKPGGLILLHDFVYANPRNPAVRGMTRQQIRQLFGRPRATFAFRSMTLAPPLARLIAPRAYWLAFTLEQMRVLNTHVICTIHLS